MNEKGKELIFYNKPYMPSAGLHGPLHMVCALSPVPAPTLALDLHAHTQMYCLLLLGQRGGGVHVLKCILLIPFESLSPILDMSLKHELNSLNYVLHLQKVPK